MTKRIFDQLQELIEDIIGTEFQKKLPIPWSKPRANDFGDISFPLFSISQTLKISPEKIGEVIAEKFPKNDFVSKYEVKGGFFNIFLEKNLFSKKTLLSIIEKPKYGQSTLKSSERIIIEHTSSNPTGPLHIGNFRGSVLGDVLGRMYRFLGAAVNIRYYINDLGRQIAPLAIGYSLIKSDVKIDSKIDLWIGKIYAIMNTFYEINLFKNNCFEKYNIPFSNEEMYSLNNNNVEVYINILNKQKQENETKKIEQNLRRLFKVQNSIIEKIPHMYNLLLGATSLKIDDLVELTKEYIIKYQEGKDKEIVELFREVTKKVLNGHIETLRLFNIYHDDFDWESDIAWSGEVENILKALDNKNYLTHDGAALLLKNDFIATKLSFKQKYKITYKIPELIIVNSEGISLYVCRDIAYHQDKLDRFNATYCYNVIGKQQQLAQLSVKLALYGLGKQHIADKISHFDYEYVSLIGGKMAAREFEYVTPDQLYEDTKEEIKEILEARNYTEEENKEISNKISASSIKYQILKIDPQKKVVFDVKKAVDPNENTGPFLQYSYARALSIIKKAPEKGVDFHKTLSNADKIKYCIEKDIEWEMIKQLEDFPSFLMRSLESLRPDSIANFAYDLASSFHKFYDSCPVLIAEKEAVLNTRLMIVYSTLKCLESIFEIMGIDTIEKM